MKPFTLVAHRGFSAQAPENTIAAFDLALTQGYSHIELDLHLTSDGVPVVIHDEMLDRTTTGFGPVSGYSLQEIKQLDAGSWFSDKYAGVEVPTFAEVLRRYRGVANIHVEFKSIEPELPDIAAALIRYTGWMEDIERPQAANVEHRLVVSSFHQHQLARSREVLPAHVPHELLVTKISGETMKWAAEIGASSYNPDGKLLTPEIVDKAHALNLKVGVWWWTRQEQNAKHVTKLGADSAFVDSPKEQAPHVRPDYALGSL